MEPTIRSGEYVTVDYKAYESASPAVGDIVSFQAPAGVNGPACGAPRTVGQPCRRPTRGASDEYLVKRIVALPGDRVAIRGGGHTIRNGLRQAEPFIRSCHTPARCDFPKAARVLPGHYFVMGDNRPYSLDSRHFGPVSEDVIEGRVRPLR